MCRVVCLLVVIQLLLILSTIGYSQNLVPNPGFECGEKDPCDPYQSHEDFSDFLCDWFVPTLGTTDVYSTKIVNKNCYAAMPYTGDYWASKRQGSQSPRTGNRFIGLFTSTNYRNEYREYAEVKLTSQLIPGETYCAEMYVSAGESGQFGTNNLGFYFSVDAILNGTYRGHLLVEPQVNEKNVLTDTDNWLKVSGEFKAEDSFNYLTVGNFYDDANTIIIYKGPSNDNYFAYAYYFIDDILVEIKPHQRFALTFPSKICQGDSIEAIAEIGTDNVFWTTLDDTLTILNHGRTFKSKPMKTTSFRVKAVGCSQTIVDTVKIEVYPRPMFYLGQDTTICRGTELMLDVGIDAAARYGWNGVNGGRSFVVRDEGLYVAQVENTFNCTGIDSIRVFLKNLPTSTLSNDTLFCDQLLPINVSGHDVDSYTWSNGVGGSNMIPSESGIYWVTMTNRCGITTDSINILLLIEIFIPNVITLNSDGLNDHFRLRGVTAAVLPRLRIFNRWGREIYYSPAYHGDWPNDPEFIDAGTYYYQMDFSGCKTFKGWINVLKSE